MHRADERRATSCTRRWSSWSLSMTREIKYSTLQNWYPRRQGGQGRRLQLRHQAGQAAQGRKLQDLLDPGGDRLGHHLEIPQRDPAGGRLGGRVLLGSPDQQGYQQADTGTKMVHMGKNTRSTIISKGISAGHGQQYLPGTGASVNSRAPRRPATSPSATPSSSADQCSAHTTFPTSR